ncbi:class I SAM-dependent RNA methyltransferase [Oryzomonas sagensis]|uniref:Class I SAM-dependent RNA methyltransferase n=1 Tax=Oryzomonas sagensis TaxID=2603857 RepID=A0ABQ6TN02_9BACT|nr:class I SAM-dependent RNA methyltransferase [Oryzomonas sagensis]KAB0669846.1 class I SAM-dependent RNA methyltransferase [Oryzomonas sagensis]
MSSPVAIIDKLAFGGNGVCRIDGKVCFVPLSCPGDEVRLTVIAEKRSYVTARIAELVTPSPLRVAPPCPLFGTCGGCSWQHIAYSQQLAAKRSIHAETLWRGGRVEGERVGEAVASPLEYGYRNRVQFKLHAGAAGLKIGFFRNATHVVDDAAQGCPIAAPAINEALSSLRSVLASFAEVSAIPQINIECGDRETVATINYIGNNHDAVIRFFQRHFHELIPLTGLFLQTGRKSSLQRVCGDGYLAYAMPAAAPDSPPTTLTFRPGGFSQVNSPQNRAVLELVRRMAAFRGHEQLLDLYCGNGNFSLPLAGGVASVTGVEGYGDSIATAQDNCRLNGVSNAEYVCADAAEGVARFAAAGRRFDTVILDPPRSGAAAAITGLSRLKPDTIIYISCDSSTLARDCGLLAGQGYHVAESVPLDMFPQTFHLESVTLLHRGQAEASA